MSATALQLNWTNVSFASVALTRVTSVMVSMGGELIDFAGDNNRFPVAIANSISRPRVSITSGDVATLQGLVPGMAGTFLGTQPDMLGATGGAVEWTITNMVSAGLGDGGGNWGQVGHGTLQARAYATDGATNPISITRA